jgi:hypothetical protein
MNIGANARRYLQLPGYARQAQQQTMSPVTFSVVMKMSGMASTAIGSPIPSAGIPIVTTNGEMTSNHPCGTREEHRRHEPARWRGNFEGRYRKRIQITG